ncbi:MAG: D-aminoacyl-tRNA deacylase [Actinomycetota bacterium]|nr:D-aminoacyl-tRNA deacylase [Actinomycetota bacterium]
MRAVISRVRSASVAVDDAVVAELPGPGLLVLLGIGHTDTTDGATAMARKIAELRLLREERSVLEAGAPVLVVSQFTLYGDTRKGRRPSWSAAARPEDARPLVDAVVEALRERGVHAETGRFGADMAVVSVNDGPFTVLVDT